MTRDADGTGGERPDRPRSPAALRAAIEDASRSLGVEYGAPEESEPGRTWERPLWIVAALLAVGIVAALALRGAGGSEQAPHLVEADLRWAVARVVEHVERERLLRGRLPEERELRLLLGETLDYEARGGAYVVSGRRDGVRVVYDGSVPVEQWRALVRHRPGTPPP